MNLNISQLYTIAQQPGRNIIGLMSGTSLDGLDIALCNIRGSGKRTILQLKKFTTVAYDEDTKAAIRSVFSRQEVNLEQLTLLNEWIGKLHASMINDTLQEWNIAKEEIDMIASHGQTVYHAP